MTEAYYKIDFSDPQVKQSVLVTPGTEVKNKLDITLYGRGRKDYGERILENMVHMLENFCSNNAEPQYPTKGQLWYNSGKRELSIFIDDGAVKWYPITTAKGFDSTGGVGDAPVDDGNAAVTVNSLKVALQDYLHLSAMMVNTDGTLSSDPSKMYGNIVLDDTKITGWFDSAGMPTETSVDTKMHVTPRDYVDKKITQKITTLLANVDLSNTKTAIADVITTMDLPFIYRDDTSDAKRTMSKPLILMSQSVAGGIGANDAVSKTYLEQYVNKTIAGSNGSGGSNGSNGGSSTPGLSISDVENIINTMNNAPWVKKVGDTLTGQLEVPNQVGNSAITDDTLITKGYVDSLFVQNAIPPIVNTGNTQMTGTILPDGSMFIRGYIQGSGASGWRLDTGETTNNTLGTCTVIFDPGLLPADTEYTVILSETIPKKNAKGMNMGLSSKGGAAVWRQFTDTKKNIVRDAGAIFYTISMVSHSKEMNSFGVSVSLHTPGISGSTDNNILLNDIAVEFIVMGKHKGS